MKRQIYPIMKILIILFLIQLTCQIVFAQSVASEPSILTISTSYKTLFSTPDRTGMLDKFVIEIFRRIGIQIEIVFNHTSISLEAVNEGFADVEINRIEGMEKNYPNLIRVPEPNMVMDFVAFAKQDFKIEGWDSIKDSYIGLVKGWKILEDNTAGFPNVTIVPTETELFTMLEKGRIDIAIYSKLAGYEQIMLLGLKDIHHLEPPLTSQNMYLYLNKKHMNLVEQIAQALKDMKEDGTYEQIVKETTSQLLK